MNSTDLRNAAERLHAEADRLDALAAELEAAERRPHFASITETADALGIGYDAARKRVDRAGAGRSFGREVLVDRRWLDTQVEAQRVRSTGQISTL